MLQAPGVPLLFNHGESRFGASQLEWSEVKDEVVEDEGLVAVQNVNNQVRYRSQICMTTICGW